MHFSAIKRISLLLLIFVGCFLLVTALRNWHAGEGFRLNFANFGIAKPQSAQSQYTPSESAALALGDVEILSRINQEYARLTKAVVPSVVSIDTAGMRTERRMDLWGRASIRNYPTQGQGSGVIVSEEGHIVTNHHVIAGQQKLRITVHGGKTYPAVMVGEDPLLDIAVIKIDSDETFSPLKLGDSSLVEVGQIVFAVGNPFGLGETVTQGIISAKERSLSDTQRDLFQTDAAINPGNSGGPLVNLMGEIIGINVAIFSADRENPGFQGVGFSIPSNEVRDALNQIITRGRTVRGFLGVEMRDIDRATQAEFGYQGTTGSIVISTQPGSPAQKAGLLPNDIIWAYNGEEFTDTRELIGLVQSSEIDETVRLNIWRNGEKLSLKATITEAAPALLAQQKSAQVQAVRSIEVLRAVGAEVRDLTINEKMRGLQGVVVTNLLPQGQAAKILTQDDVIVGLNGQKIRSRDEFYHNIAATAALKDMELRIIRSGMQTELTLPRVEMR